MSDLGVFLFTFKVDGNRFVNATCVKLDSAGNTGGIPVSLITKGNLVFRADSSGSLVIYDTEKKTASPGVTLGRGPLHKIEGGPGEYGNLFLAQFNDHIEIWNLSEVKKLYSGRTYKTTDICWLDGCLATIPRTSGGIKCLPISPDTFAPVSTNHLLDYAYFLSPRDKCLKLFQLLKQSISNQELLSLFLEVCAFDEAEFWSVVTKSMTPKITPGWKPPVDGFNIYSPDSFYKEVQVRIAQAVYMIDMSHREQVCKVLLYAGESEKAAEIFLDTEPSDPLKYMCNGMKASICVGANGLPESTKAVLKITATNLIASGQIQDGLEMLCLLMKYNECMTYMLSSNDWPNAILLAKTSLNPKQSKDCLAKYANFLNTQREVMTSASIYAYIGKWDRCVEVLFGGRRRHLSYLVLLICEKHGCDLTNLSPHVKLAIRLDFCRFLFDSGLSEEAIEFCENIGDEAKDLKSELEILRG